LNQDTHSSVASSTASRVFQGACFARDFNERFPGFETDLQSLVKREVDGKRGYFGACVRN
jgi:hypothetical protein